MITEGPGLWLYGHITFVGLLVFQYIFYLQVQAKKENHDYISIYMHIYTYINIYI